MFFPKIVELYIYVAPSLGEAQSLLLSLNSTALCLSPYLSLSLCWGLYVWLATHAPLPD